MSNSMREEMIRDFIEEVKTYVPSLRKGLQVLKDDETNSDTLDETYRLVHTVKGASAMVGLSGLSQIAFQMEEQLEGIVSGKYTFSREAFEVMNSTIDVFEQYCEDFFEYGVNTRELLKKVASAYRKLKVDKELEDDTAFVARLTDVPKWEGMKESNHPGARHLEIELSGENAKDSKKEVESSGFRPCGIIMPSEITNEHVSGANSENSSALDNNQIVSPILPQPELLESFYEEAEEHLEELGNALNSLSEQTNQVVEITPDKRDKIRRIRRAVHTLKGASAVIGFDEFSKFAHRLEDLLDWLYETAPQISPDIIIVLTESSDQLERIVTDPQQAYSSNAIRLTSQYDQIMGKKRDLGEDAHGSVKKTTDKHSADKESSGSAPVPGDLATAADNSKSPKQDSSARPTKTLRVSMDRVDELVYLAGELIISSSVFDQKMEKFIEAVSELELTRNRLRDIAREMELSYEVKALERLSPALNMAMKGADHSFFQGGFDEFDTLELDRYSELNMIIRTLNESVVDIGAIDNQLANTYSEFDGNLNRQRVIISELQDKIMRVRMTPMSIISNRMRRTVREVAGKLNKQVRLEIEGEDIELDRIVWEKMTDPLMHLLRNAVDHGVESAEQREAMQKPPMATITLAAVREGNQVLIRVQDDGSGLDYAAIRATARRYGNSSNIETLAKDQLSEFIFYPGFSTCSKVSEVSGRGVGMDIVRENIRKLKGDIQVFSEDGKGTEFVLRIPLTLAAVRALLFSSGGQTYAIALNEITEIIRSNSESMELQEENVIRIGNELLPLYHLADYLNPFGNMKSKMSLDDHRLMLIIENANKRAAIVIDSLVGQREIVIKSLGSHLRNVRGISGATILGDGSVVPILNVLELFWSKTIGPTEDTSTDTFNIEKPLEIMIVDDSVSIRKVVSRLMEGQGWRATTAKDGVDALEMLQDSHPDLIILDIEMPRLNGYELLGKLRSQSRTNAIPVVMLSSRATKKHKDKALALGAKAFMVKPYNDDEFIDLIRRLTQQSPVKVK